MNIKYSKKMVSIKAVAALIVLFALLAVCTPVQGIGVCNPPNLSDIPDQSVPAGDSFATINLDDHVEDSVYDDSSISWTTSGATNLIIAINETRVANITYTDGWTGSETITFTATNPCLAVISTDATFTVNQAPVVSGIPDQTVNAGELFTTINLDDHVTDDDVDSNITWSTSGETNLTVSINETRVANITYPAGWTGSETITFTATDPYGLSGSDDASFTVVNQAPVVSGILDQSVPAGELFTMINLDLHVVDDSDVSDLTWSTSGETDLTVAIDADRVATITYPDGWSGSETITFTATDPYGLSGSDDASFTVVNQAPMVSDILDQSVPAGELFTTINLDLHVTDDSVDSEITWTTSGETELTVAIDADRVATITYPAGWTGSETITFTATDPGGLSGSDDASFTVVNQAPMVSDILDQSVSAGESFATINLDLHVQDDSADSEITWTTSGETDLTIVIDADRVATITYRVGWTGSETITFTATDPGGLSGSDEASFAVVGLENIVDIDIKPESCPNPVNLGKEGLLPVAIIGTEDFDIKDIDPDTILLTREGCDSGVAPIRWNYEDVATPYTGTDVCGCHELGGDGCLDMSLKFDNQGLVNELNLANVVGLTIPLTLTGELWDGTLFEGQDCIWVLETKK